MPRLHPHAEARYRVLARTDGAFDEAIIQRSLTTFSAIGTARAVSRGTWTVDEADHFHFENVAITQMACEDVDTWLAGLDEATVGDDTMTVLGQDGYEIGALERSD